MTPTPTPTPWKPSKSTGGGIPAGATPPVNGLAIGAAGGQAAPMPAIRNAAREDCNAIGAIHVAAWRESYAGLLPDATLAGLSSQRRADQWRRWLDAADPDRLLLLAEDDDGLCAFAACRRLPPGEGIGTDGEVTALYVLRRARRRGTGRELLQRLLAFMAERGMVSAGLWVLRENGGARAFYRALGGVEGAERTEEGDGQRHTEVPCVWRPLTAGTAAMA